MLKRLSVVGAGISFLLLSPLTPAAHADSSSTGGGPIRDAYSSPGYQISVIGRPMIVGPRVSAVKVRYQCDPADDVQIGATIAGRAEQSNRWARFGYPFTPAVCDGKMHVTQVLVNTYPQDVWPTSSFMAGDAVRVGADLIDYETIPGVGSLPKAALAGHMKANIRIVGPGE